MSLPAPYQEHYYIGDGETVEFPFGSDFTALAAANVKCIIYFQDGTSCVPTFTVNMEAGSITIVTLTKPDGEILTVPPLGSVVRVFRDTPEQQNVTASQLQNYTAKQLERIFDAIVAMIQEGSYFAKHKTLNLTETQRDVSLEQLGEDQDQGLLYWDAESGTIKSTAYGQDELIEAVERANNVADEAKSIAQETQGNLTSHVQNLSNPHQTSMEKLTDVSLYDLHANQFLMFDGAKWKNVFSTVAMFWGEMQGDISDQTDLVAEFAKKVNKSGDTMTGDLSFQYNANDPVLRIIQSGQNTNHFRFINNNSASQSISFDLTQAAIHPLVTGRGHLGTSSIHFGDAYVDTIYTGIINNGYNITVPVTAAADSFALESEITDINGKIPVQASTTNQLADKNFVNSSIATNTADFKGTYNSLADLEAVTADNNDYGFVVSTDSAGNTVYARYKYNGTSWVFEYNLNNSSFTSDQWAAINSGVTASDVSKARTAVQPSDLGNGTITINQGGTTKGTFTTNQGGNTTIDLDAGSDGSYHPDLFDVKWADHQLNDMQWLRADTFSWQDGTVYEEAYQHLLDDADTSVSVTETIAGTQITYLLAQDGHKIVDPTDESKVTAIYNATGVAWYYIVDPINHRFKLPRENPTREELIQAIKAKGSGLTLGLVSNAGYTGGLTTRANNNANLDWNGSAYNTSVGSAVYGTGPTVGTIGVTTDADKSGIVSDMTDSTSVFSGKKHLYFYVGSFTQTALENTAGLNAELFNGKADTDLSNVLANIDFVVESQLPTAANNYTWYRKYKSGWVEQGGVGGNAVDINLPVTMADTHYTATMPGITSYGVGNVGIGADALVIIKTTTSIKYGTYSAFGFTFDWQVSGIAAS